MCDMFICLLRLSVVAMFGFSDVNFCKVKHSAVPFRQKGVGVWSIVLEVHIFQCPLVHNKNA